MAEVTDKAGEAQTLEEGRTFIRLAVGEIRSLEAELKAIRTEYKELEIANHGLSQQVRVLREFHVASTHGAERFLAHVGFADSVAHSSTEIARLMQDYAALKSTAAPPKKQTGVCQSCGEAIHLTGAVFDDGDCWQHTQSGKDRCADGINWAHN